MVNNSTSVPQSPGLAHWPIRVLGWGIVLWSALLWRLGYLPLLDPDEAHYAAITREMMQAREWLVPLLDGAPYIDKPVLFHWLQAAAFSVLGPTEVAARLPSVAAALALIGVTWWLGRHLFGAETGERAALMLATLPATFALSGIGVFDMVFTAFLFGGLGCLAVAALAGRPRLEVGGYLLLALAVLTKGPVALVLVGLTCLVCLALPRTRPALRTLRWGRGLALILAVAIPWFAWMWWTFGDRFVEGYLLYGNLWLFSRPLYRERLDTLFYARTFLLAFFPWSLVAIGRLIDAARGGFRGHGLSAGETLLWVWSLAVIGFFTFSRFKLDTYIYPAAPAICLLAAHGWQRLRERVPGEPVTGLRASLAIIPLVLLALGGAAGAFLFDLGLPVSRAAVLLPVALIAGGLLVGAQFLRRGWHPTRFGAPLLATLVTVFVLVGTLGFPVLEATRPTPALAGQLLNVLEPEDRLAVYELAKWRASLRFYTNRPVIELETWADLHAFFTRPGRGYALMRERDAKRLIELDPAYRIVFARSAVVQSERGRGLRRQRWATVVVVTRDTTAP